jgi:enoyl-CoA hydratase/carnithine racemase
VDPRAGGILTHQKTGHCLLVELAAGQGDDAASEAMAAEMAELCDLIAWDDETRVVVLEFDGETNASLSAIVSRVKQPVIAAIKGNAVGSGLELAGV